MTLVVTAEQIVDVAQHCTVEANSIRLMEEVLELLLAERGKHEDSAALEWLEIATIVLRVLDQMETLEFLKAISEWHKKHGAGVPEWRGR